MAAMTILAIIVLIVGMIFSDADRIWYLGTGRTMNCMSGRAAMNLITHDLEYAVADDMLTFAVRPDRTNSPYYANSSLKNAEMCFVSLQHDSAGGYRTAREVFYFVTTNSTPTMPARPGNLMRGYYSSAITDDPGYANHCYYNRSWYEEPPRGVGRNNSFPRPIVENVVGFSVYAPTNQNGGVSYEYYSTNAYAYATNTVLFNSLPEYVDVCLEVLDELDATKLYEMEKPAAAGGLGISAAVRAAFVERNARRYTTRVYFQNRLGYKKR